MRSAPIAYFADEIPDAVVEHACIRSTQTHAHADGIAGAMAVAVAAAAVFAGERDPRAARHRGRADAQGPDADGLNARFILRAEPITVAAELGNGSGVISSDTIPFAVWCAATHLADYAGALGAVRSAAIFDTTCTFVGGIIVGAVGLAGIPANWHNSRKSLLSRCEL